MRRGDLVFGGATLVVSVAYYQLTTSVPVSQLADAIGPQGMPKVYALILTALSLILIINAVRDRGLGIGDPGGSGVVANRRRSSETDPLGSRIPDPRSRSFRAIGMLAIGVAYVVLAPWLGYLLGISGLILATTYYQGGTVGRHAALVAVGGGVFFWLLFVVLMGIPQPPGFFPQW